MTTAKIYVPDAVDDSTHQYVKSWLAEEFGGYTAYDAQGGWRNDDGDLVEESVTVYEIVAPSTADGGHVYNVFSDLAHGVKHMSDESAVMAYVGASADSAGETIYVE